MNRVRSGPRLVRGLFLWSSCLLALPAAAAPYLPSDDAQVLEPLPAGVPAARARLAVPREPLAAAALARDYIERSRRDGDPRFLGYAEGVLKPWWNEPVPPAPVLLLRATLLQARHRFTDSLRDLDALLVADPHNAQALLTRATVLRVRGRYGEAEQSCAGLDGVASAFVTDLCVASVRSLHGALPEMATALDEMAQDAARESPGVRNWYRAERADMAERLGQDAQALKVYRAALAENGDDPLLRAAAADLLLRLKQPAQALKLTGTAPLADVLRLRTVLAQRALGKKDAALEAALADSYAASRRRGEDVHLREEARFTLEVLGDAARALALAQDNWAVQREPADALLLQTAARAAGKPEAAAPVAAFQKDTGLQDARLAR